MWRWEQGRLEYFQFDELRKIAKFGREADLRQASRSELESEVGLPFYPADPSYKPWRNYARLFQIAMIATPVKRRHSSELTLVGKLLAQDGKVTTDEYLHFLAQATSAPSPALSTWNHAAKLRYPLLFALRFLLARATQGIMDTTISEVVSAYKSSGFVGSESQTEFLAILTPGKVPRSRDRQASESIKVLEQLSYLTATTDTITVSLAASDAGNLFCDLKPIAGTPRQDRAMEIARRAELFPSARAEMSFDFPDSILSLVGEAGFGNTGQASSGISAEPSLEFEEGARVRRTHLTIERNQMIRKRFFEENQSPDCDLCGMDTSQSYPWASRLLEVHHLLPLCSGARTTSHGTVLEDLVANCPTCHRAVHRYYDHWLSKRSRLDFSDAREARKAYTEAKHKHREAIAL